jgi:hypothetical protein
MLRTDAAMFTQMDTVLTGYVFWMVAPAAVKNGGAYSFYNTGDGI